jgi:hypothetical protein
MHTTKILPGINIQWPWSELILSGKKTVETRGYPLPTKYIGKELAIIETPGRRGAMEAGIHQARITGVVVFRESFLYGNKTDWIKDKKRHLVSDIDHQFGYHPSKEKWAWVIDHVIRSASVTIPPIPRGIVFAGKCKVTLHQ